MGSNFHYTIDLNEDKNHQSFLCSFGSSIHHNHDHQQNLYHHQAPSNPTFSSSSLASPSLSYFPFLINSHQDQVHVGYNNHTLNGFPDPNISQPLETKKLEYDGGSAILSDQMMPKKETRAKLTIRKNDNHHDQTNLPQYRSKGETETNSLKWMSSKVRLMKRKTMISTTDNNKQNVTNDQFLNDRYPEEDHFKKISKKQYNSIINENGYNGSNNCVIRFCSDCNTTKTPLWRSGPRGPKSLCNACGIRQRKAKRAAMAATAATTTSDLSPPLLKKKKKMQNKNKRSNEVYNNLSSPSAPEVKKYKSMTTSVEEAVLMMEGATTEGLETQGKPAMSSSSTSSSSDKFYFDDLAIILSKSSAYQQSFPQDEKEAAILLMALSYGMVHG